MPTAHWLTEPALNPERYQFVQLLSLVLRDFATRGIPYEQAMQTAIRFSGNLSLAFPASETKALDLERDQTGMPKRVTVTPGFIGLLGVSGALPLHDTERFAQKHEGRDEGGYQLSNLLSQRVIAQFFEAWAKYRVEHSLQAQGKDRLLPMLLAIAGRPGGSTTHAYFAGLLSKTPLSAAAIESLLAHQLSVPVRLEQFVGAWSPIPSEHCGSLGKRDTKLGMGAVLGTRQWRYDRGVQLHIGPLELIQAQAFLGQGPARQKLIELLQSCATPGIVFTALLRLADSCIRPITLSSKPLTNHPRLGRLSFLTREPGKALDPKIEIKFENTQGPANRRG